MESRLNVVIVDVNFNERLAAIETHKSLIRMLGKLIDLCKDIRVQWTVMMECLTHGLDAYGLDVEEFVTGARATHKVNALKYTTDAMNKVHGELAKEYNSAIDRLGALGDLRGRLDALE